MVCSLQAFACCHQRAQHDALDLRGQKEQSLVLADRHQGLGGPERMRMGTGWPGLSSVPQDCTSCYLHRH